MKTFEICIDIQASQVSVWNALLDFDNYENWNPIFPNASGTLEEGQSLHLMLRGKYTPVEIVAVEEGKKFILSRNLMHKNLIHLEHYFELTSITKDSTRVTQRWQGSGFLTPFLWPPLTQKLKSFKLFNDGLKTYLEN